MCRINGYPASDPCVRMPPAGAYWAFFHAKRGGSWAYSSSGVASYNPAPGSVVGFRFGSGQQPGIAPPAATKTSTPTPTKTVPKPKPKPTTAAPKPTTPKATTPKATSGSTPSAQAGSASVGAPREGPDVQHTVRHALGERHGIRLGEPDHERDGHVVGEPERDGIRPRGRSDIH